MEDDGELMVAKGVWWDVANCPFPDEEFSLSRAKPCIESVLNKYLGPGPVTIYAIVDARNMSRSKFIDLAASGILMIHDEFAITPLPPLLKCWTYDTPPPAHLLVLSDLPSTLYTEDYSKYGYSLFRGRTRPAPLPPRDEEEVEWHWDWKNLLETEEIHEEYLNHDYPHLNFREESLYEPPFLCTVCEFSADNPADFFYHLDSSSHIEEKKSIVETLRRHGFSCSTPEISNAGKHENKELDARNLIGKFESDNVEKLKGKGKNRIPVGSSKEEEDKEPTDCKI